MRYPLVWFYNFVTSSLSVVFYPGDISAHARIKGNVYLTPTNIVMGGVCVHTLYKFVL